MKKGKRKLNDFVRTFDIFGKNVELNYNGSQKIKTPLGGIIGVIFMVLMIIYSLLSLRDVWENKILSVVIDTYPISEDPTVDNIYFS